MKEEEGPTIDLLCIVKIIPAIISINPIIIRYFPIFFGRCTVFISLHKIRVFVIAKILKIILVYVFSILVNFYYDV